MGCNLCVSVCPVEECITMEQIVEGTDLRTKKKISNDILDWDSHPSNPMNAGQAE